MADSLDSGSSVHYGRAGSSPASRTMIGASIACSDFLLFTAVFALPQGPEMAGGAGSKTAQGRRREWRKKEGHPHGCPSFYIEYVSRECRSAWEDRAPAWKGSIRTLGGSVGIGGENPVGDLAPGEALVHGALFNMAVRFLFCHAQALDQGPLALLTRRIS